MGKGTSENASIRLSAGKSVVHFLNLLVDGGEAAGDSPWGQYYPWQVVLASKGKQAEQAYESEPLSSVHWRAPE